MLESGAAAAGERATEGRDGGVEDRDRAPTLPSLRQDVVTHPIVLENSYFYTVTALNGNTSFNTTDIFVYTRIL